MYALNIKSGLNLKTSSQARSSVDHKHLSCTFAINPSHQQYEQLTVLRRLQQQPLLDNSGSAVWQDRGQDDEWQELQEQHGVMQGKLVALGGMSGKMTQQCWIKIATQIILKGLSWGASFSSSSSSPSTDPSKRKSLRFWYYPFCYISNRW